MNALYLGILFASLSLAIAGQLSLKKGMLIVGAVSLRKDLFGSVYKMFSNHTVMIGVLLFGFSVILWMLALTKLDLSYAYPLASMSYVLIALSSRALFNEHISALRWFSIFIICMGVILVSTS